MIVQLQLEASQSRTAQVPLSSEMVQPSPPVGPQPSSMSTSPLDRFKQWRASITPMVCNVGSAIERAATETAVVASANPKIKATDSRDTAFDKTLRVLDKAMALSEKKSTKKTYAVFRAVWSWFVGIAGSLSYERVFTLAWLLYATGPTLMPLARSALLMIVRQMVCMASQRLMVALQDARARTIRTALAFFDASPVHGVLGAVDGGVMRASSSPVAVPVHGTDERASVRAAVDDGKSTSHQTSQGELPNKAPGPAVLDAVDGGVLRASSPPVAVPVGMPEASA